MAMVLIHHTTILEVPDFRLGFHTDPRNVMGLQGG